MMNTNVKTVLFLAGAFLIAPHTLTVAHTDVTPDRAQDLVNSTTGLVVVDVREPFEYCDVRGHIPRSVNYPWNSGVLQVRYGELPMQGPILVVCRSEARSHAAATFPDSKGFPDVYDMTGGMNAWKGQTAPCQYSGGSGTADDPCQIATAADLIALGETPDDYDKYFILTADIDLDPSLPGGKVFDKAVIGVAWPGFTGIFDGSGHTISHLTITGKDHLGLFGCLGSGGAGQRPGAGGYQHNRFR